MDLTFYWNRAGRMVDTTCRLQKGQVAAPNGPAKTLLVPASRVSLKAPCQRQAYDCHAASGMTSRAGRGARGVLGRRGNLRQRGRAVDGFDDLIGREVMDHVAEPRKNGQLALGDLLVQSL